MTIHTDSARDARPATPAELGVGLRFSLHPHTDDFVGVILGSLDDARAVGLDEGLTLETDEVSTYVGAATEPAEERLAAFLVGVMAAASRRSGGGHVVAHALFSRGCPGETTCDLRVNGLPTPPPVALPETGIRAAAQWSLYPLIDGGTDAGDHMVHIERAIAAARDRGVAVASNHYATRLSGDLSDVIATAVDAWTAVGTAVPHVVTHLTISLGSPSASDGAA